MRIRIRIKFMRIGSDTDRKFCRSAHLQTYELFMKVVLFVQQQSDNLHFIIKIEFLPFQDIIRTKFGLNEVPISRKVCCVSKLGQTSYILLLKQPFLPFQDIIPTKFELNKVPHLKKIMWHVQNCVVCPKPHKLPIFCAYTNTFAHFRTKFGVFTILGHNSNKIRT